MKLNREQIIKALEHCVKDATCEQCNYSPSTCFIQEDTLSLIKELTEENERLKSEVSVKRKLLDKAEVRIECVEEENNQLKADICNAEMNLGHITEDSKAKDETITNLIETIKSIQADTVRKMQSEIERRCIKGGIYPAFVARTIDKIAKDMLGEGK